METISFRIQNLKCGGCANQIQQKLKDMEGISMLSLNIDRSLLCFAYEHLNVLEKVKVKLRNMGYPIENEPNTLKNKTKSYVSCMIGRVNKMAVMS
ncbi:MAG: heavy-metal-associated domain-containing protein [Bacteroidota bacterium]